MVTRGRVLLLAGGLTLVVLVAASVGGANHAFGLGHSQSLDESTFILCGGPGTGLPLDPCFEASHAGLTTAQPAIRGVSYTGIGLAAGVLGQSRSGPRPGGTSVAGVYGLAEAGIGVRARSRTGVGLEASGGNGAADFFGRTRVIGNLEVVGTVVKSGGGFRINHPLDESKYLQHSFVESPDMMNVYNGNIRTNARGFAQVTLPRYFQALNRDFRYQLTPIGEFADAIVAREIRQNRFTVRTDKPNIRVSWQVTGIRKDAYAKANRVKTELKKTAGPG